MGYWSNLFKSSSKGALRGGANTLAIAGNVGGAAFGFIGQCGPDKLIFKAFGTIGAAAGLVPGALAAPFWFAANAATRQPAYKNDTAQIASFKAIILEKTGSMTDKALNRLFSEIIKQYKPRNSSAHSRALINVLSPRVSEGQPLIQPASGQVKLKAILGYLFQEKNGALYNDGKRLFKVIVKTIGEADIGPRSTKKVNANLFSSDAPDAVAEYCNGPHHYLKI